jgi:hypothetical protein
MKAAIARILPLAFCLLALTSGQARATQVTITLDVLPSVGCDQPWFELDCRLMFTPTQSGDCSYPPALCAEGGYVGPLGDGVALFPARLVADVNSYRNMDTLEVSIYEASAPGCTKALLYEGATLVDVQTSTALYGQVLAFAVGGRPVTQLVVAGGECLVLELRFIGAGLVDAQATTWGAVKGLYGR